MNKKVKDDFCLADFGLRFKDLKQRGEAEHKATLPCIPLVSATHATANDSN